MDNTKLFKKGEHLFKAGDKITAVYAIQSGSVTLYLPRPKQNIEMYVVGNSQFIGEQALFGMTTHVFSAQATQDTKVFEVPVDFMKSQIEATSNMVKLYARSMGERSKYLTNELKSYRLERDNSPCPADTVPRAFAVFYHVARYLGKIDPKTNRTTVDWRQMRSYCQRVFMEPIKRLEQVLNIMVKLKVVELQMVKNEEDPKRPIEELGFIHVSNIHQIEQFFEFYQHLFFKGKNDLLKIDEACYQVLNIIMKEVGETPPDKKGTSKIYYAKFGEAIKRDLGIPLTNLQFERLEQKGLFVKRATESNNEVMISFDNPEFVKTLFSWKVLREIDKWNEKGFVDVREVEVVKKLVEGKKKCASCQTDIEATNKFCPGCGTKVAA